MGDHGHGRAAGRIGDLVDQHGLRRRIDRQTGDDLVVEPRHQPDVRGAELPGGGGTALPGDQLPARRPGAGYDPAFAGRLFPGLQRRRPRRFPHDRTGAQFGAGDARPCGRGVRPRVQIPQPGDDPRRRGDRADDGEGGARAAASPQDRRRDRCRVPLVGYLRQACRPQAQYRDVAGVAVREDGDHQQAPAGEIQGARRERGAL